MSSSSGYSILSSGSMSSYTTFSSTSPKRQGFETFLYTLPEDPILGKKDQYLLEECLDHEGGELRRAFARYDNMKADEAVAQRAKNNAFIVKLEDAEYDLEEYEMRTNGIYSISNKNIVEVREIPRHSPSRNCDGDGDACMICEEFGFGYGGAAREERTWLGGAICGSPPPMKESDRKRRKARSGGKKKRQRVGAKEKSIRRRVLRRLRITSTFVMETPGNSETEPKPTVQNSHYYGYNLAELTPEVQEPTRRVVPKFSSFKPIKEESPPPTKDHGKEESRHDTRGHKRPRSRGREKRGNRDNVRDHGGEKRRRESDRDRDRARSSGNHREREHRHRHRSRKSPPKNVALVMVGKARSPSPESWDAPEKQYFTDTRGDPHNITYGTIHRYSVPDYRRHGFGVVGLSSDIRIDRDKGDGKGLVLVSKRDMAYSGTGRNTRHAYARAENEGVKMLRIKKDSGGDDKAFETGVDFVPISSRWKGKKRKHHPDSESGKSEPDEDNHYRSIEGLKKAGNKPEDQDLEYVSSSDSDKNFVSSREWNDRRKNVEFIKKVEAEPKNVDIWMEYVDHQDTLLAGNGRRSTVAERTSTAEVKLDILTKALEQCPGDGKLLSKYMDVAETIWDPRKVLSKWQQILKDNPAITGLWTKYINFRQADFRSFTYPECIKCFSECLSVLRSAVFQADKGLNNREKLEDIILYVFLRSAILMREAGYVENAIAAFQSILELNFFCPPHLTPPTDQAQHKRVLGELKEFWDSEVLRIGEPGAKGWASYAAPGGKSNVPDTQKEKLSSEPLDPRDLFGSWMDAEEERLGLSMMPARTIDEVEEDDPYRVVLFSDLEAFMFCFSQERVKRKIIDSFLLFSGLTPVYYAEPVSSSSPESTDTFLRNDVATMEDWYLNEWFWPKNTDEHMDMRTTTSLGGLLMEPEKKGELGKASPFKFGLRSFPVGHDSLFSSELGNWIKRVKKTDVGFIGRTLKMLVDVTGDEGLAVYYLAWAWQNQPEGTRKLAKALLKKFRTSLLLWNGYAQIEWQDGKVDAARNVFSTALGMSKGFPEANRRDAILLWKAWAWGELGDVSQAVRVLLSIESGKLLPEDPHNYSPKNIQPALLLKARKYLDEQQNLMVSMGHIYHAVVYNEIRALLEYLSHDQDISIALPLFKNLIEDLERRNLTGSHSAVHELCLMAKSRLLYHHSTTAKMFKMKIMRDVLEQALTLFPSNSMFLGLYAWNEGRTKIENRVRTLMRDIVLDEGKETIVGWIFAIWAEMRMVGVRGLYNIHAVRALLEQAVECDRTKSNVGLWIIFVEFELRENEPRRAKEALFRGVRCCPWSKDLALLAFRKLRHALDFEEMRKLLSIISSEKELRVHDTTELEDMIEEMAEAQRDNSSRLGKPQFLNLPDDGSEDEEMRDED